MALNRFKYWWPRVLVIGFAASLLLPMPGFLSGMDHGQFVIYLARVAWVLGVPAAAGLIFLLIALAARGKKNGNMKPRNTRNTRK